MKLITLNTWGGRVKDLNKKFFDSYADTNIWCFQEIFNKGIAQVDVPGFEIDYCLLDTVKERLENYAHEFCPSYKKHYGIATFLSKDIEVIESGEVLVARGAWDDDPDMHNRDHHRKLQWIEIKVGGRKVLIANVHLTHRPEGKADSDKRLGQSKMIVEFLNMFDCPKILCGDFNLLPDTESIKIIESAGMRNLIKEYKVPSTRTELYKKEWKFADYIFVSPEVKVNDFKVLPDVVSDHSPLYLDFEI